MNFILICCLQPHGGHSLDYYIKLFQYRTAGVKEYWIADPQKNRLMVYNFEKETCEDYTLSDCVTSGIYEDLTIDLSMIRQ